MLDSFPQDVEAPATRYLLGEVLFESGRYAEAAREYERTAYDYPLHAKSSDAGYAALIAYQKHETSLSGESKSLWHRQYIESSLMFATSFPEHAESARVLTKSDEELFALNEFDRVIEVSKQILERNPPVDRSYQRTAATLMAHSLFDRQRYVEAEAAYLRAKSYLAANDPDRPAIEERIAASIYKQAEAKQSAGDANGAVDDFLRVGMLAPNSKVRANAEFDAASILVRNKEWDRAAQVLEGFRRNYPNHELMPEVTRNLAVAYLETGRSTQAAGEFERIAARAEETPDVRRAALWQAAELYEKSASPSNAARLYASYVQQYPLPLDPAMDARHKLADMAKAQNDYKARAQWNEDIIRADAMAGPARSDRSKYLAAKATLEGVEPQAAMFTAIKLVAPLDKSLKSKRTQMEKVTDCVRQGARLWCRRSHHGRDLRHGRAVSSARSRPDGVRAPARPGCRREGTVRRAARGTGVPVRGKGHRAARDQHAAHRRRRVRRVGAAQLRRARQAQAGALCQGGEE